jgi:hypothetical protein
MTSPPTFSLSSVLVLGDIIDFAALQMSVS